MSSSISKCSMLLLGLAALTGATAGSAAPESTLSRSAQTPKAVDLGALEAVSARTPISVTVALKLTDLTAAESLLESVSKPGSSQYRQFLTTEEFESRFAPAKSVVASVIASLQKYGLTAEQTTATTLKVTGLPTSMDRAFGVSLHSYDVEAQGDATGYRFHAPVSRGTIPAEIASVVSAVAGLDSRPYLHPHRVSTVPKLLRNPVQKGSSYTLNPFGSLTVTDFAHLYDVEPLYAEGITGKGRTIGIMSFANFTPKDVFAYWSALGLSVNSNRLKIVLVDGGPGAPSDASGSMETTLDVEQSGGIAPGANMIAYLGPNTDQAFVDVFAAAIEANKADSLSISWGSWEWFDNFQNGPVTDPLTGRTVSTLQAVHELLVRAGLQGQTVSAAAGDGGAYDVNDDLGCAGPYSSSQPLSCANTLSVDYPASDPAITAGGGTTLPGEQEYCLNSACTPPYYIINLPHQRVWGWDYLEGLCNALGITIAECGIFPGGGGGGVSFEFFSPQYQTGVFGTQLTQPHQVYQVGSEIASLYDVPTYYALPAFFAGRNVPDASFNADPETGYVIYYTSSVSGFAEDTFWGGTSFVAPQLNGVASLLGEYAHQRLGLLNYPLYAAQRDWSPAPPLRAIAYGDNWFYYGRNGYSPAAGLGVMDVANFARFLRGPF
jgi:kumamolisin